MTIRDLFVSLGFEVDEQSVKQAEQTIQGIKKSAQNALVNVKASTPGQGVKQLSQGYKNMAAAIQSNTQALIGQQAVQQAQTTSVNQTKAAFQSLHKVSNKFFQRIKKPAKAVIKPVVDDQARRKAVETIKGIRSTALKLLGAIGIGFSLVNMNALAEEFNGVNDMIRNATRELGDQAGIQQTILSAANEMKSGYAETAKIVSNLVQESPDLFGSVDEAANFATLTTKLFKSTGKSQEEINGLQEAINKSFAKGIVDSETINQLYEKAPEAINMISDSLGVAKESLAKMATDGTLKVADLKNAFISHTDVINQKFDELDFSISDALLNIRNQWGYWLDQMNSTTGFTKNIGKFMVQSFSKVMAALNKTVNLVERLSKMVGGYGNLLKLVGAIGAGLFIALKADKIIGFLKTAKSLLGGAGKLLNAATLKVMAIAAVVAALFLVIDDFINFMKGNDSVIGKLFEKAGIDADKARQTIVNAWKTVVGFLTKAWGFIRQVGEKIWGGLGRFWEEHGQSVKSRFLHIWNAISGFLGKAWSALRMLAEKAFNGLKAFWERWGDKICNQFTILWNYLTSLIDPFLQVLQGIIDFITGVFTGNWTQAWEGIKSIFGGVLDAISAHFHLIWDTIHNWFGGKIDAVKETLINGFNGAVEFMQSLPEKALQWGHDFIDGLVQGIKDKIGAVTEAVAGVGEKIKSFLHFSVPDEGPLTDYESWMPDFMAGLAKGIRTSGPVVYGAVETLAKGISAARESFTNTGQVWSIPTPDVPREPDEHNSPDIADRCPTDGFPVSAGPQALLASLQKGRVIAKELVTDLKNGFADAAPKFMSTLKAGLQKGVPSIVGALGKLADLTPVLGDLSVKPTTVTAVQGGGSRTTNVQQTNHITNKFEGGDRAAQVEGAKAMGKTADDTTAQMARALATGR